MNLYRLFSNLTRFSPSSKFFSKSVTDSVMADVEIRRNLFDTTRVASDSFDHTQISKIEKILFVDEIISKIKKKKTHTRSN